MARRVSFLVLVALALLAVGGLAYAQYSPGAALSQFPDVESAIREAIVGRRLTTLATAAGVGWLIGFFFSPFMRGVRSEHSTA